MNLGKSLKTRFSSSTSQYFWLILIISLFTINVSAQVSTDLGIGVGSPDNDNSPRDPDHLIDNIWWVGHTKVGAFLITTPEGHFLMDSTSTAEAHDVIENVVKAGFHLRDIKYIINTHAHEEHIGGLAAFKHLLPQARIITTRETAEQLASGDADPMGNTSYEPVEVDGIIGDRESLTLGGVTLVANHTPGHTKGVTTWSMQVTDQGNTYDVVFMGGLGTPNDENEPGLLNNELYPNIVSDFEKSFRTLRSLPCDVFMTYRAISIDLDGKLARKNRGGNQASPFVDPESCVAYIDLYENRFLTQLAAEQRAAGQSSRSGDYVDVSAMKCPSSWDEVAKQFRSENYWIYQKRRSEENVSMVLRPNRETGAWRMDVDTTNHPMTVTADSYQWESMIYTGINTLNRNTLSLERDRTDDRSANSQCEAITPHAARSAVEERYLQQMRGN